MADKGKSHIQRDWEQREFIETIVVNVKKVSEFLNRFDMSARYQLACINERLSTLEARMQYVESALRTLSDPTGASSHQA